MGMSEFPDLSWAEPATGEPDPVIDAYKRDVDRTLLRANLARTVEERSRTSLASSVSAKS